MWIRESTLAKTCTKLICENPVRNYTPAKGDLVKCGGGKVVELPYTRRRFTVITPQIFGER